MSDKYEMAERGEHLLFVPRRIPEKVIAESRHIGVVMHSGKFCGAVFVNTRIVWKGPRRTAEREAWVDAEGKK